MGNPKLWIDLETYSEVDLKTHGLYRYARDPSTEIMLVQYAIDDGPVHVIDCTATPRQMPEELRALRIPGTAVKYAHNAQFERVLMNAVWGANPSPEPWYCTQAQANAHSLPGGLGKLSEIFKLDEDGKLDGGRKLINLFCKPRPKNMKLRRATPQTHPEEWAEFVDYARQDVVAMRELHTKMPRWNFEYGSAEHQLWCLDQRINDRGFQIDRELAEAAVALVERRKALADEEIQDLTDNEVGAVSQRDQVLGYLLRAEGVHLPDLTRATLERYVDDPELSPLTREILRLRLDNAKAAVSKYAAALRTADPKDDRVRGGLQFCGALRTGRWAGRHLQPQNFARPSYGTNEASLRIAIDAVKSGAADLIYDKPLQALSDCLRPLIIPRPGNALIASDWSNIEGRSLAWLAGEEWKLDAFRAFDAGEGPDVYNASFARSFNRPVASVTKPERQIGKVQELALGYYGGAGAFVAFAAAYNMDLEELARAVHEAVPSDVWNQAAGFVDWMRTANKRDLGLPEHVEIACEVLKFRWRDAHPATVQLWNDIDHALRLCLDAPGKTHQAGRYVQMRRDGNWTKVRLPSGRILTYLGLHQDRGSIKYWGVNSYTRQWAKLYTYAGKMVENITQAFARDVMAYHMPRLEAAGYPLVLTVHDEPIAEVPDDGPQTAEEMCAIMASPIPWAPDLPLAAGGFRTHFYRKDD